MPFLGSTMFFGEMAAKGFLLNLMQTSSLLPLFVCPRLFAPPPPSQQNLNTPPPVFAILHSFTTFGNRPRCGTVLSAGRTRLHRPAMRCTISIMLHFSLSDYILLK